MADPAYLGARTPNDSASGFNAYAFLIQQMIADIPGATIVRVVSVTNSGGISPIGNVDVQPMVNQIDGAGAPTQHGVIHNLPYARLQGGHNAVILDPQEGDLGVAVFASRDLSSVKQNGGQANPGSRRQHDWADGIYLFSVLKGTPTQYVQFSADGITIVSPTKVTIQEGGGSSIVMSGGTISTTGLLLNNGIRVGSVHIHPQGADSHGDSEADTGPPQ